jgi:uncharacterized protein YcbK (DUF882 family)
MTKYYSLSTDAHKQLAPNFTVQEFACNDDSDAVLIDTELVQLLQTIRNYYQAPLIINSAYRTPAYNHKIGGASESQHLFGKAADIVVRGITPVQLYNDLHGSMIISSSFQGGLGLYKTFVHIDVRHTHKHRQARWKK